MKIRVSAAFLPMIFGMAVLGACSASVYNNTKELELENMNSKQQLEEDMF